MFQRELCPFKQRTLPIKLSKQILIKITEKSYYFRASVLYTIFSKLK